MHIYHLSYLLFASFGMSELGGPWFQELDSVGPWIGFPTSAFRWASRSWWRPADLTETETETDEISQGAPWAIWTSLNFWPATWGIPHTAEEFWRSVFRSWKCREVSLQCGNLETANCSLIDYDCPKDRQRSAGESEGPVVSVPLWCFCRCDRSWIYWWGSYEVTEHEDKSGILVSLKWYDTITRIFAQTS